MTQFHKKYSHLDMYSNTDYPYENGLQLAKPTEFPQNCGMHCTENTGCLTQIHPATPHATRTTRKTVMKMEKKDTKGGRKFLITFHTKLNQSYPTRHASVAHAPLPPLPEALPLTSSLQCTSHYIYTISLYFNKYIRARTFVYKPAADTRQNIAMVIVKMRNRKPRSPK